MHLQRQSHRPEVQDLPELRSAVADFKPPRLASARRAHLSPGAVWNPHRKPSMGSEDTAITDDRQTKKNIHLASQKEKTFDVLLVNFIILANEKKKKKKKG